MERERKEPRYFKEANTHFKVPGGYSPNGALPGVVLFIMGVGLGYPILIPFGIALSIYLSKKLGEDPNFLKSMLWHLWVYKGMRFIVAARAVPQSKVIIHTKTGQLSVQEWVARRTEGEHGSKNR